MNKWLILLLLFFATGNPQSVNAIAPAQNVPNSLQIIEKQAGLSEKKLRKLKRLQAKILTFHPDDLPDRFIWMGLFGLGLALCLSFFSVTLGGIVAAAALACLIIGGVSKIGRL